MNYSLFSLGLLSLSLFSLEANAQEIDLDSDGKKTKSKKSKDLGIKFSKDVREIERGWYAKSSLGATIFLTRLSDRILPGTNLGLAVGQDFIDQENYSMAWEVSFAQGVHNGREAEQQAVELGCVELGNCVQGDTRLLAFNGMLETSYYVTRRLGIGVRAGGGVYLAPLLMNDEYYVVQIVDEKWGGVRSTVHDSPHFAGAGGLTFEYYTKLAHFSMGLDADAIYIVGMDLGVNATGYFKYTF